MPVFEKDGVTIKTSNAAEGVRLRARGFVEQSKAAKPATPPERGKAKPSAPAKKEGGDV